MKRLCLATLILFGMTVTALAQAYCKLGEEKWVSGCAASCTASWSGSGCPSECTATAPPGYVITNHRLIVGSTNNGGRDVSLFAKNQEFDYARHVSDAYLNAIDFAGRANNKSAEGKLREQGKSAVAEAVRFSSSNQMIRLRVNASKHGSMFDRKRGWSNASVDLLVKCIVPADMEKQLFEQFALSTTRTKSDINKTGHAKKRIGKKTKKRRGN